MRSLIHVFNNRSSPKDARPSDLVIKSAFGNATDICYFGGRFFWTTPSEVFYEDGDGSRFSHNPFLVPAVEITSEMSVGKEGFLGIALYHQSVQPVPVPSSEPRELEVLFSSTAAKVSWRAPPPSEIFGNYSKPTFI